MTMREGDGEVATMPGPRIRNSEVAPTLAELKATISKSEKVSSNGVENGGSSMNNGSAGNNNSVSYSNGDSSNKENGAGTSSNTANGNAFRKKSKNRKPYHNRNFSPHDDNRQQQHHHSQQYSRGHSGNRQQQNNHGMEYRVKEPKKATSKETDASENGRTDTSNRREFENGRGYRSAVQPVVEVRDEKNQKNAENGYEAARNERMQALRTSSGPAGGLSARVIQQVLPQQQIRKPSDLRNGVAKKDSSKDLNDSHNGTSQVVKEVKPEGRKIVSAESRQTKRPAPHDQNSDSNNQWVVKLPHGDQWVVKLPHGVTIGPFSSGQLSSWHNRFYGPEIEIRRQNRTNWVTLGSVISELKEGMRKDTGHLDNGHSAGTNHDSSHATGGAQARPQRKPKRNIGSNKQDKLMDKAKSTVNGNRPDSSENDSRSNSARVTENHLSTQPPSSSQTKRSLVEAATALFVSSADWRYLDDEGTERGPFDSGKMMQWYNNDFLPQTLKVRRGQDKDFQQLTFLLAEFQDRQTSVPSLG